MTRLNISAADTNNMCRCFPDFDSALLADVVTAVGLKAYNGSSTLYSSTFGSASQRLQRYIADIHKGILIILVSGKCPAPSHMTLRLSVSGLSSCGSKCPCSMHSCVTSPQQGSASSATGSGVLSSSSSSTDGGFKCNTMQLFAIAKCVRRRPC